MLEGKTNFFWGSNTSPQDITLGGRQGIPKLRIQAKQGNRPAGKDRNFSLNWLGMEQNVDTHHYQK